MKKKNAFTLIELIAVLVILAVIALIVTPLVLNIVKKAKDSANKRSVDAYGKAVELAVATYLLDTGNYPTSLDNLTVEYSGNEVVCNVKTLNEDGSIYLSECTVKGTEVKDSKTEDGWYHYGKTTSNVITYDAYSVGDQVTYNGMDFYVIANSDENSESVTLLKAEPLTVEEVNKYGTGHINNYTSPSVGTAYNSNGYGAIAYYTSDTCGYVDGSMVYEGCTTDYDVSEVKYVVDAWGAQKFNASDLKTDSLGYKTRLLTKDEIINNFSEQQNPSDLYYVISENAEKWICGNNYNYWTMSTYLDSEKSVWVISTVGMKSVDVKGYKFGYEGMEDNGYVIRPVVTLLKSAITK